MRKSLDRSAISSVLMLLSPAVLAADYVEQLQNMVSVIVLVVFALFIIAVAALVYFKPVALQDESAVPLRKFLNGTNAPSTVQADAWVWDCITMMTKQSVDSVLIMNGEMLVGIFTDRDALRNVLIPGRDPHSTRICEVMTLHPCCVTPMTSVGDAIKLVTERRFKHLPIVENGQVQALVLRRDLKRWSQVDEAEGSHRRVA